MTGQRPPQWFCFGPWTFSIDEAETLIAEQPRQPVSLNVPAWANAYGLTHIDNPEPRTISLIGPPRDSLNRAYAMRTDLTKPVLVATLQASGEPAPLLIDGVHRLYHAWHKGITTLPAYLLTLTETQQITHNSIIGGVITPRRRRITPRSDL